MRCGPSAWWWRTAIAISSPPAARPPGRSGCCKAGPWMRPVLVAKGIDPDTEGRELARYLVDELHARLMALAAARPRFQVVDMRAALPVDNVHWADEIHPSGTGFRELAEDCWRPCSRRSFPAGVSTDARRTIAPGARPAAGHAPRQGGGDAGRRAQGLARAVHRPFRQEQTARGAAVRARAGGGPVPDRPRRASSASTSATPRRISTRCSRPPRLRMPCCCSTTRITCSASAQSRRGFGPLSQPRRRPAATAHRDVRRRGVVRARTIARTSIRSSRASATRSSSSPTNGEGAPIRADGVVT